MLALSRCPETYVGERCEEKVVRPVVEKIKTEGGNCFRQLLPSYCCDYYCTYIINRHLQKLCY